MKKYISIVLFGVAAISLTGCYTQLVIEENDDSYVYQEPIPVIIYYPALSGKSCQNSIVKSCKSVVTGYKCEGAKVTSAKVTSRKSKKK